jgi:hypothetical protein
VTRGFMGPLGGFWPKTRQEACDRLETTVMRPSGTRENKQTNKRPLKPELDGRLSSANYSDSSTKLYSLIYRLALTTT